MRLLPLLAALCLAGCATGAADDAGATFLVVRHAEKADASRDPPLSPAGAARARALAALLQDRALDAVYTTDYRRTRLTVQPAAAAHALQPIPYDADAAAFARRLKARHPRGVVLIAGHGNTVPAIVAALCGCAAEAMADDEYDRLSRVQVDARGRAILHVDRYGSASP